MDFKKFFNKRNTIIFLCLGLLILVLILMFINNFSSNKIAILPIDKKETIKNIYYDYSDKKLYALGISGDKRQLIKDISFSADDTFVNLQSKFLVLNHYSNNTQFGDVTSYVYEIKTDDISEIYSANGQVIFAFTDKNNYSYRQGSNQYTKYNGKDNLIGFGLLSPTQYYLGQPTSINTTWALGNNGFIREYDNITGSAINEGFSGLNTSYTYFIFIPQYRIIGGSNVGHNNNFIDLYPSLVTDTSIPVDRRNTNNLIKEIIVPNAPTIMSYREGNKLYFSSVVSQGKFANFILDLSNFQITQIKDFTASQELLY